MPSPLLLNRWDGHRFVLKWKNEAVLRALPCLREAYQINVQSVVEVHDVFGVSVREKSRYSGR